MYEFTWTKMFLFVVMVIQFTEVATGKYPSFTFRRGDDAILPFENVIDDQDKCYSVTWLFSHPSKKKVETLFEHGKIHKEAESKSDRLSVTENCSLVIKKVTDEDVGHYTCRQFDTSGRQQGGDSGVDLSVVTTATSTTTTSARTTENSRTAATTTTTTSNNTSTKFEALVWFFTVIVILIALITIAAALKRYKKRKANITHTDENPGLSLNPAEPESGPETSQDTTDPEDAVFYTSVSFTKKTSSKVQVQSKDEDDDEGDAVTYSTMKTSSSSDPSSLYSTVNKRQK